MKEETKQAIQNYAREVRGRVAHRVDDFFNKRGELSDAVSIEVARFAAAEAADSVNCFLFVDVENISLEEAKLFIDGAGEVKVEQVNKAINHFRKRLSMCDKKKSKLSEAMAGFIARKLDDEPHYNCGIAVLNYCNADVIIDMCSDMDKIETTLGLNPKRIYPHSEVLDACMAKITDIESFKVGEDGEIYLYANDIWFKLEK